MNKLVTELALLSQNEQEKIKEGLQNQIEHKAKLKMETAPEDYLQYLEDEIENAKNALDVLADESTRVGAILPTISFNYVWNKERLNTLRRLLQEWESKQDAAAPEPQQVTKKLGRKSKSFSDCILINDKNILPRLKKRMEGLSSNAAIELIKNAISNKAIIKPPYKAFKEEFPEVAKNIPESTYYNRLKNF